MVIRTWLFPVLAVVGVGYAVATVMSSQKVVPPAPPVAEPATSPFTSSVAGAGIIEASSENIAIGSHRAGLVSKVHITAGQRVKAGDPLFTVDERAARAMLAEREAALAAAHAGLARLRAMPRAEDLPPARARVAQAEVALRDMTDMLDRAETAGQNGAATNEEVSRRRYAKSLAEKSVAEAQADLAKLEAGAWSADIAVAEAEVASAQAAIEAARTEVELRTVRSPIDAEVLQVNIRPGEHASDGDDASPQVVIGSTDMLHIRVDIDENDAWRVRANTRAVASLRGHSQMRADLTFVRFEPLVVPKKSLTGSSAERIDTRVLQVLYAFPREALPAYVGQLVDVYIDAGDSSDERASR
jgi:HlyD family secretion protein